jgi:hypothetical protein
MRLGVLVALAGCGRLGFDGSAPPDGSDVGLAAYVVSVLEDKPIGYWQFEETTGTTVHDATANHHDAVIRGNVTLGVPGVSGRGIEFSGGGVGNYDGGHVAIPGVFAFENRAPFSLECWVKPALLDATWRILMSTDYWDPLQRQGYTVEYLDANLSVDRRRDSVDDSASSSGVLSSTAWRHVAATYDGSVLQLYVDGTLRGERPSTLSIDNDAATEFTLSHPQFTVTGVVDECAVYAGALPGERITTHYAARER